MREARLGNLAFIVVVIAAYLSAAADVAYGQRSLTTIQLISVAVAGLACLIIGTHGFARCRHSRSRPAAGLRTLRFAAALRPDVILMDVRMPVLDGVAATRRLHADHPIVAADYADHTD